MKPSNNENHIVTNIARHPQGCIALANSANVVPAAVPQEIPASVIAAIKSNPGNLKSGGTSSENKREP